MVSMQVWSAAVAGTSQVNCAVLGTDGFTTGTSLQGCVGSTSDQPLPDESAPQVVLAQGRWWSRSRKGGRAGRRWRRRRARSRARSGPVEAGVVHLDVGLGLRPRTGLLSHIVPDGQEVIFNRAGLHLHVVGAGDGVGGRSEAWARRCGCRWSSTSRPCRRQVVVGLEKPSAPVGIGCSGSGTSLGDGRRRGHRRCRAPAAPSSGRRSRGRSRAGTRRPMVRC